MSESSSEDENLKLIKESIDPELTNDKLYKNNPEDKIVKSPKDSLRSSVSNNDYTNLLNLAPGTQKYIATQLENYLEQILTEKVAAPCVTITNKRKRKKSKVKLFRNSEHYIELDTFENEVNQPKRKIKQEFDSDDETKIKEILITPEEILSKREVDNWAKSTRTKHIFQYKKSKTDLVSLCVLRLEVYEKEINMSQKLNKLGQRIPKKIRVETYPNRMEASNDNWNLLPSDKSEKLSPNGAEVPREALENDEEIGFFSGNPFVEVTKGIIHLYKEDALRDRSEAHILCLLGIPSAMTCHDLLSFTAPCHPEISNIRVLRDPTPNQYMALLNFRSHGAASEFRASFDGVPYSGLEPDRICRAVWVSRVEWTEAPSGGDQPPAGHTELPTCPVCLERMDESVDGVLTILCNHAFHAECLIKWGDSTCPVCRCVQSPELTETGTECAACPLNQTPQAADSLWICLVCGHVGCGRYQGGHAQMHYRETEHCYALQLGSGRVWDYKGDNFVHRLLQNKADGKLVPSESSSSQQTTQDPQDKVDAVQLEYTYLLTSQLDSQRRYFEEKLARVEATTALEFEKFKDKSAELLDREKELCEKLERLGKEKNAAEKKATQLSHKLVTTQRELTEEKQLGKALRANQSQWQARVQSLEKAKEDSDTEIANLKEQLRDLMFYLDAQQLIAKSEDKEELAEGTVTIGTPEEKKGKQRRRKR